jgi:hypothetical protein
MVVKRWLSELHARNPILAVTGWIHWVLFAALVLIYPFDHRTILGISPWIKPMKFASSIAIYVWTLGWYLHYLSERKRLVRIISIGVSALMFGEITLITLQAARGTTSHFNVATPLDAAIFTTMGSMIGSNTLLVAVALLLFFVTKTDIPRAYLWGIRLGMIVFLLASVEGVFMVIHGSHTVGAPDGGPGLPFVNWSRRHGDLRVGHFVGMHALQILPLIGYWRSRSGNPEWAQVSYTVAFSFLYLCLAALLFWIAVLGGPLPLLAITR